MKQLNATLNGEGEIINKTVAKIWGALTLVPITGMIYGTYSMMSYQFPTDGDMDAWNAQFDTVFHLMMATQGVLFALLTSYVIYLFRTEHVPKDKKALWAVVLFMGQIISMPIFWYHYIWKPANATSKAQEDAM